MRAGTGEGNHPKAVQQRHAGLGRHTGPTAEDEAYIRAVTRTGLFREANVWARVIMRELAMATEHVHFFLGFAARYAEAIRDDRRPYALDTWEKAFGIWDSRQEGSPLPEG